MRVVDMRTGKYVTVYKVWADMKHNRTRFLLYDWDAQEWYWEDAVYYQPDPDDA